MSFPSTTSSFADRVQEVLGPRATALAAAADGLLTAEIEVDQWVDAARALRDDAVLALVQLTDLCGVDHLYEGEDEWETEGATAEGFSRGVEGPAGPGRFDWEERPEIRMEARFSVVVHLLSVKCNRRLRLKTRPQDSDFPVVASLVEIWPAANWYERETFDLYGIVFDGHPDLRRLLTDYGFVGHPFRKDFPLIGNVEMRYDPEKGRVVYEPVSIEPRVLVPKVIRRDSRYADEGRGGG